MNDSWVNLTPGPDVPGAIGLPLTVFLFLIGVCIGLCLWGNEVEDWQEKTITALIWLWVIFPFLFVLRQVIR